MRMPRLAPMPLISLVALVSCASTQKLTGGTVAPGAEGCVKTKVGDNGNTEMDIRVKHLAPADKINPSATVYVVWVVPENAAAMNVGNLKVDSDLEGSLETVTPQHVFKLNITAESVATASSPSGPLVLSGSIAAK